MKKLAIIIFFIAFSYFYFLNSVEARQGCCSHHGGVCGCGCCDGTSLSATCAPYYPQCNEPEEDYPPNTGSTETFAVPAASVVRIVPDETTSVESMNDEVVLPEQSSAQVLAVSEAKAVSDEVVPIEGTNIIVVTSEKNNLEEEENVEEYSSSTIDSGNIGNNDTGIQNFSVPISAVENGSQDSLEESLVHDYSNGSYEEEYDTPSSVEEEMGSDDSGAALIFWLVIGGLLYIIWRKKKKAKDNKNKNKI